MWPMVTSKLLVSFLSHINKNPYKRLAGPTYLKYAGENTDIHQHDVTLPHVHNVFSLGDI